GFDEGSAPTRSKQALDAPFARPEPSEINDHLARNLLEGNGGLLRSPSDTRHGAPKHSYRRDVPGHVAGRRGGGEYIEAPIQHIGDVDRLIQPYGHEVSPGHLAGFMARLTEGPHDLAVLIEFDNTIISTIHHPNVLIRGNQQTVGVADASPFLDEFAVRIKDLYALILAVANIDAALVVDRNRVRQVEFTDAGSVFSPGL